MLRPSRLDVLRADASTRRVASRTRASTSFIKRAAVWEFSAFLRVIDAISSIDADVSSSEADCSVAPCESCCDAEDTWSTADANRGCALGEADEANVDAVADDDPASRRLDVLLEDLVRFSRSQPRTASRTAAALRISSRKRRERRRP